MDGDEGVRRVQFRDLPGQSSRPTMTRRSSTRFGSGQGDPEDPDDSPGPAPLRPQFSRTSSSRVGSSGSARFLSRCESSVAPKDEMSLGRSDAEDRMSRLGMSDERQLSAREAATAQEAAEAAAAADDEDEDEDEDEEGGGGPVRMSLMDLLEETDRQMGWEGPRYTAGDEEYDEEEEEEDESDAEEEEGGGGGHECSCCVCMVKHRGQPLIPCGHSYCKLCTKELYVSRGNCPVRNDFIQEILTVF